MPDTVEHNQPIFGRSIEDFGDLAQVKGYFNPPIAGRAHWITVRLTGAPTEMWGSSCSVTPTVPVPWAGDVFVRLQQLRGYPKNWDSYGGRPLTTAAYLGAYDLLGRLIYERVPRPSVVPTGRGGVQFEWHMKGSHVEVYVSPEGATEVSFEDDFGCEWEGPLAQVAHRLTAVLCNL